MDEDATLLGNMARMLDRWAGLFIAPLTTISLNEEYLKVGLISVTTAVGTIAWRLSYR